MTNIGFVGLGHMGLPMAINLVKAGFRVVGYDLQPTVLEEFAQAGGCIASELKEAAIGQDVIITMLQKGGQVLEVCSKTQGLLHHAKAGTLFIDCSTIDVQSAQSLHQQAQNSQILCVDAPVSGGVAGAVAGSLTFMVGGEEQAYDKAHPILLKMGQKVIHTGPAGSGQAAKICNNMILGISMIAISEAFVLAKQLGLSEKKLFEVVNNASGQCWSMSKYVPVAGILDHVPANRDFKPGFAALMMLKDLKLSQEAAHSVDIQTPLGAQATALYQQLVDEGLGDLDFSAVIALMNPKK